MSQPLHHDEVDAVHYPESDGTPVAETEVHVNELLALWATLRDHFRDDENIYAGANMFVYYERGNPRGVFSPDVFVTRGVPKRVRRTFKIWEEGKPPSFVMEVSSDSTWLEDTGNKKALCARLGVQEYFLFDPLCDYLEPNLQGFTLVDGEYQRIAAGADGSVFSPVLGLMLRAEGSTLRCYEPATGERLLRFEEAPEAHRLAEQRWQAAEREREQAEREREQAEREREQAERERAQAERERDAAQRARENAEQRARAAEAELARLRRK
jgi:Uma2 family endonuclease